MIRIWGKLYDKNRVCAEYIAADERTELAFDVRFRDCLEEILRELDLPKPIFLPQNRRELESFRQTQFRQEHFIEHFPYKIFEVEILETDDDEQEEEEEEKE